MITFEWEKAAEEGGSPVLDYVVYWDYGQGTEFVLIAGSQDTDELHIQNTDLIQGGTYQFKVKARNIVGYSNLSDAVAITAAVRPEAPDAPVKVEGTRTSLKISWNEPDNGGSPITLYKIDVLGVESDNFATTT